MFERWKKNKFEDSASSSPRTNNTGIGARGAEKDSEEAKIVQAKLISTNASRPEIIKAINHARNMLVDEFDLTSSPDSPYTLSRVLQFFDFTIGAIEAPSTILTTDNLRKFFAVLDFTERNLIERIGISTSESEAASLTSIALAIVQSKSLVLAKSAQRMDYGNDERFVEILARIHDRIRVVVEKKVKRGLEGKEFKAGADITLSGMQKLIKKLKSKKPQRMSQDEEEGIVRELFNIKLALSRPESANLSVIANVTADELDELFVLVYV